MLTFALVEDIVAGRAAVTPAFITERNAFRGLFGGILSKYYHLEINVIANNPIFDLREVHAN